MGNDTEDDVKNFQPGLGKRVKALAGRTAIVTGTDPDIGRTIALRHKHAVFSNFTVGVITRKADS